MEDISIKSLITGNKIAKFSHAIAGNLYYRIDVEDGTAYQFKVNTMDYDDVGTTTFNAEEKAILMMRYLNKSKQSGDLVRVK